MVPFERMGVPFHSNCGRGFSRFDTIHKRDGDCTTARPCNAVSIGCSRTAKTTYYRIWATSTLHLRSWKPSEKTFNNWQALLTTEKIWYKLHYISEGQNKNKTSVSNQLKSRDWFQYFAQISNVLPKLKALKKNTQMGQQNYSDSSILTVNSNYIKFTDMNQGTDQNGPNEGRKRPTESLKPKRPILMSKTPHYVTLYKYGINDVIKCTWGIPYKRVDAQPSSRHI